MAKLKALLLTEGYHGMISQVEGLAKALKAEFQHKIVRLNLMWNYIPPKLTPISKIILKDSNYISNDDIQEYNRKMNDKRPNVALFVTCLVDSWRPSVGFAAVKLLKQAGCMVSVPLQQTCCGQPAYNNSDRKDARVIARQVISAFDEFDYVRKKEAVKQREKKTCQF